MYTHNFLATIGYYASGLSFQNRALDCQIIVKPLVSCSGCSGVAQFQKRQATQHIPKYAPETTPLASVYTLDIASIVCFFEPIDPVYDHGHTSGLMHSSQHTWDKMGGRKQADRVLVPDNTMHLVCQCILYAYCIMISCFRPVDDEEDVVAEDSEEVPLNSDDSAAM